MFFPLKIIKGGAFWPLALHAIKTEVLSRPDPNVVRVVGVPIAPTILVLDGSNKMRFRQGSKF